MAPGDLNLKKSWNPALIKNQKKVWEREQEALAERKKIEERQEEIRKEKEIAELKELQYAKTGKKVSDRVEWMYNTSGVGDGNKLVTDEAEEYLLGKKRVDELILKKQKDEKETLRGFDKVSQYSGGISQKEEMSRSREDPMMKIQQQRIKKMQELANEKDRKHSSNSHRSDRHHSHSHSHRHRHRHDHDDESSRSRHRSEGRHRDGKDKRDREPLEGRNNSYRNREESEKETNKIHY